jgi:hypothetical protein
MAHEAAFEQNRWVTHACEHTETGAFDAAIKGVVGSDVP